MSRSRYSVVSEKESTQIPYPYVWMNDDRTYRELTDEERAYLEEEFSPADGARPYVKFGLYSKTPDGKLGGFVERRKLPGGLSCNAPVPPKPWWRFW